MESNKKRTRIKTWLLIAAVLVIYLIFLLVPNIGLSYYLGSNPSFEAWYADHVYVFWLMNFFIMAILWLLIMPLLRLPDGQRSFKEYFKSIKLSNIKPISRTVGLGLLTSIIILAFAVFTAWLETKITGGTQYFIPELLVRQDLSLNVYYALAPGIWEEVAFRGMIFALLLKMYSEKKTVIINGVMFGLFHLVNLVNIIFYIGNHEAVMIVMYRTLFQVVYTIAIGLFLAYMFSKTKSLLPVIMFHYLLDGFANFLVIVLDTNPITHQALQTVLGIGIVPCAVCFAVVWFVYKKWPKEVEELEIVPEKTP